MCMDKNEWDVEVIRDVLNPRDQEAVMRIQLNESCNEDGIYWSLEDSGVYIVKSAYKFLQTLVIGAQGLLKASGKTCGISKPHQKPSTWFGVLCRIVYQLYLNYKLNKFQFKCFAQCAKLSLKL